MRRPVSPRCRTGTVTGSAVTTVLHMGLGVLTLTAHRGTLVGVDMRVPDSLGERQEELDEGRKHTAEQVIRKLDEAETAHGRRQHSRRGGGR